MKMLLQLVLLLTTILHLSGCSQNKKEQFIAKEVYKSKSLVLTQVSENSYEHTSYKQTNDFGLVPCNGLVVINNREAVVFDTPTNNERAKELIRWVQDTLHTKIIGVVPTHFHDDCLGGLEAFHKNNIPSYAYYKTIELAKENNLTVPVHGFSDSLVIKVGNEKVIIKYFGQGHTKDNVVAYFPADNVLFGGCLIKEVDANKGYLGDANTAAWSETVRKVQLYYPKVKVVVPGHGRFGDKKLLEYTINLFKTTKR